MKNIVTRRGNTQEVADKINNTPEFISGQFAQVVTQAKPQAPKMPKQVWQYPLLDTPLPGYAVLSGQEITFLPRLTAVLPPQGREMAKGFTLIELLVVVLIIGILAAVALPQYQKAVLKTRLTEALVHIHTLQAATDAYLLANGEPTEITNLTDKLDVQITPSANFSYGVVWDLVCDGPSLGRSITAGSDTINIDIHSENCNNRWITYCTPGANETHDGPSEEAERICTQVDQMIK